MTIPTGGGITPTTGRPDTGATGWDGTILIGVDKEFEGSLDEWDIMIDTNIRGLLAMTRLVVPGMVAVSYTHL